jgi:hypothetical protein
VSGSSTQPTKADSDSIGSLQLLVAHVDGVNFMPPSPPSINQYDNGAKGNYWSDYNGSDNNGDGIGDTVYYLYENNQDNYPLMKSVSVSGVPTVPVESPSSTPITAGQPPENRTQPDDTLVPQGTVRPELPIECAFVAMAAVVGVVAAWNHLLHKRKYPKTDILRGKHGSECASRTRFFPNNYSCVCFWSIFSRDCCRFTLLSRGVHN